MKALLMSLVLGLSAQAFAQAQITAEVYCKQAPDANNHVVEYSLIAGANAKEKILLVSEVANNVRKSVLAKGLSVVVNDQNIYALASTTENDRTQVAYTKTNGQISSGSFDVFVNDNYVQYATFTTCTENVNVQF